MALFFLLGAIGTGGVTLDRARHRVARFRGVLFVPLLRRTYRLDPSSRVYVHEARVERRNGSYLTYTAVISSAGTELPLRHFFVREQAEAQAARVREYLRWAAR